MDTRAPLPSGGSIVVVGGANTDVAGFPDVPLVPADSNPGRVRTSAGGVGRNIAENLARLGATVSLVTAFGSDHSGRALAEECRGTGIDVTASLYLDDIPGSLYLAILDRSGDLALALNDMRALERITPNVLADRSGLLSRADLVVVDANLPADALEWLAGNVSAPIVVDPVSVAKAPRWAGHLARTDSIKASALEASVLTRVDVVDRGSGARAARLLVEAGVVRAFVTLGPRGVCYASEAEEGWLPAPPVTVVNASGAGDAFTAGLAYGRGAGLSLAESAAFASGVAAVSLEDESTVATFTGVDRAVSIMKEMLG